MGDPANVALASLQSGEQPVRLEIESPAPLHLHSEQTVRLECALAAPGQHKQAVGLQAGISDVPQNGSSNL